jgi:hypothetical protein
MGHDILGVQCEARTSFPGDRTTLEDLSEEVVFSSNSSS